MHVTYIKPNIFPDNVVAAQSTRLGGVSLPPYNSLNLGKSTLDAAEAVTQNRHLFFNALDIAATAVALSKQVHGCEILTVEQPLVAEGYDALITHKKNVFVAVSVADCVPILLYDGHNQAVAAIHAGWRGTVGQIVSKTLVQMQTVYGTQAKHCKAFIGACIGYSAFEVDENVAQQFKVDLTTPLGNGKFLVDLKTANLQQLVQFGISENDVEISPYCTVTHNHLFFSHRFEKGTTGRMLAVIGIRA